MSSKAKNGGGAAARAGAPSPKHWGTGTGPEELDLTPVEMPLNCTTPRPLNELVAMFVARELQSQSEEGAESFEEADDFEYPTETNKLLDFSPYELQELEPDDPTLVLQEKPPEAPEAPEPPTEEPSQPNEPEVPPESG